MAQLSDDGYRRVAESSGILASGSPSPTADANARLIRREALRRVQEQRMEGIFLGWSEDWGYPRPTRDPLDNPLHASPYRGRR